MGLQVVNNLTGTNYLFLVLPTGIGNKIEYMRS